MSERTEHFKRLHTKNVLLVEDNDYDADLSVEILESNGLSVKRVKSAEDAISFLRAHHNTVDIIMIDLTLPEMSGLELIKYCYNNFSNLSCVILSGSNRLDEIAKELDLLMTIVKPIQPRHCIQLLARLQLDSRLSYESRRIETIY